MKAKLLAVCVILTGCGSLKTRNVNPAELNGVKKVAIASFSFLQPHPRSVGLNLGNGRIEGSTDKDLLSHENDEVTQTYNDAVKSLSAKMKWNVVGLDELRHHPSYRQAYDSKMKGWQNKGPMNDKLFVVKEIMDAQSLRRMRPNERDDLMQSLNVDALMEAQVSVIFANTGMKVMGIGSRYPQAVLMFYMYKKGVEAPVWFEGQVMGDVATESVGKTAFWDENAVTRLGRLSARSAFNKLNPKQE